MENYTSTWFILKLLTVFIITLAEVTMVTFTTLCGVTLAPATHTVSSTLTLSAVVPLTGCSQGSLIFIANGTVTELTHKAFTATEQGQLKDFLNEKN